MLHESNDNKTEQYFFQILMGKLTIRALLVEIFEIVFKENNDIEDKTYVRLGFLQKLFWKSLPGYKILEGLDKETRIEILEVFFGTGIASLSDLDKRINALKVDASRLWDEDIYIRGAVFDLIFKTVEKMFDIDDKYFSLYIQSVEKEADEFEAIQVVSDLLDMFELRTRKCLLSYRSIFEEHKKTQTFLNEAEKTSFRNDIQCISDKIFEEKMGTYVGKT